MKETNANALTALQQALGKQVLTDEASLFKSSFDALKYSFIPEAVIIPTTPEAIGTTLKLANQFNVPVTPRGMGSTLTGSATPIKGGWVLNLTKLNKISIDPLNRFAHVEAGALVGDIQSAAEDEGLFYPPDPSSSLFCTIGGNIACNAGGLRGIKYGVTRDYVVALKGYLPTGEAVSWGLPLKKFTSGYNMRDLWIGSEGTLGIVSEAVLKLIPKPQTTRTFLASFADDESALFAARALIKTGIIPSALEFMDTLTVLGVEEKGDKRFQPDHALLLIELDSPTSLMEHEASKISHWGNIYANKMIQATAFDEIQSLWHIRRECSRAMFKHGNAKLNEDVVVPLNKTVELIKFIRKLSLEKSLKIPTFGHVGDGNFHVNIMYNRDDTLGTKNAEAALEALMEQVVQLGGVITGEHGIGLSKSSFLKLQHSPTEIDAMLAIKNALDPRGILNPGKIFTPCFPMEQQPISIKMPWER